MDIISRNIPDEILIDKVKDGDVEAFEMLVKRYSGKILSFVFKILHDRYISEEVVQDSFFSLYKSINRVDTKRKFSSYLYKIAKNKAIEKFRTRKNQLALNEEIVSGNDDNIYEKIIKSENKIRIRKAVDELEKKYRDPISLYFFENLSYDQIAEKLSIPVNTIRTRLKRGKTALRKKLI
ncbi:RNA polymerase sigma factor [Candidatus Collierbacteria bacterium]|nr:RNA polymerase sigma factor [Candidatus Collierbacteria bacterium]